MISIKKNIWTLFYIILLITTILFLILSFKLWNDTYHEYKIKNENYTKIISTTFENHIDKIDLILTIVGRQLLENDKYKDRVEAEKILRQKNDTPLKEYIFALVGTDGYVKGTSRKEIIENTPNLLDTEGARETFLETLKSKEMVIGRTYPLAATGKYTIPIRKTFRHKNGEPAGVLSVAIALDKFKLLNTKLLHSPSHIMHILRDKDRYRQIFIHNISATKKQIYDKPLTKTLYNQSVKILEGNTQQSIEAIKQSEKTTTFKTYSEIGEKTYLISLQYIKKYAMFVMYYTPNEEVIYSFISSLSVYLLFYIVVIAIVWKLFNYLSISEKEKISNFEKSLYALAELIEDRDTYTGGHTQRVANYSKMIAKEMSFSKDDCELIYKAGLLHDIGKVATPDTILLKPTSLNDLEYELIKDHVTTGTQLLKSVPMYQELSDIIQHHHERYDGKGYPDGLEGKDIPPLSRIMIVADSFDAMTTSRVYKARKNLQDALQELKELSGIQFDPEVVESALVALKDTDLDLTINQKPKTTLEKQRFAYFYIDQLTHLHNREYLKLVLSYNNSFQFAYGITLHNFTNFNQTNGWNAGNELLVAFSKELTASFPNAMIVRIFGDDFIVLNTEHMDFPDINTFTSIKDTEVSLNYQLFDFYERTTTIEELEDMFEKINIRHE